MTATVDDLFKLTNAELIEAWRQAKVAEIEMVEHRIAARSAAKDSDDHLEATHQAAILKLEAETIRLVISHRLMGRQGGAADLKTT